MLAQKINFDPEDYAPLYLHFHINTSLQMN